MASVTIAPGPFVIGNDVTVTETFKDAAGTPVIPGSVFFEWRAQDKNGLILQGVTPVTPTNHGGGVYSADVPTDPGAGVYYWRFWSSGSGKAAEEGGFAVLESQFIPNVPGLPASPADGQILVAAAGLWAPATLVAGVGIAIVEGSGLVTISATGSGGGMPENPLAPAHGGTGSTDTPQDGQLLFGKAGKWRGGFSFPGLPGSNGGVFLGDDGNPAIFAEDQWLGITFGLHLQGAQYQTDGTHVDDGPALQTALNAAHDVNGAGAGNPRVNLYVQAGIYYIGTEVDIPNGVKLWGAGPSRTIFVVTSSLSTSAFHALGSIGSVQAGGIKSVNQDVNPGDTVLQFATGTDLLSWASRDVYAKLISEDLFEPTENDGRKYGELIKIVAVGADQNGTGASVVAYDSVNHLVTINVPGASFNSGMIGLTITIFGAATSGFNTTSHIDSVPSPTQIVVFNKASGLGASDANNGSIGWKGPSLSVYGMVRDQYRVDANARVVQLVMNYDSAMEGFTIKQQAAAGTRDGTPPMISMRHCVNPMILDVRIESNDGPGFVFQDCYGGGAAHCYAQNLWDFSGTNQEYGYGFLLSQCCEQMTLNQCHADRVRHGFDTGNWKTQSGADQNYGEARECIVSACTVAHATDAAFSTHTEGAGMQYIGCYASNCDNVGFYLRAKGTIVKACTVEWCSGGFTVGSNTTTQRDYLGSNSEITLCTFRHLNKILVASSDQFETGSGGGSAGGIGALLNRVKGVHVHHNKFESLDASAIQIRGGCDDALIHDNQFIDCNLGGFSSGHAITLLDSGSGTLTVNSVASGIATLTSVTTPSGRTGLNQSDVFSLITIAGGANAGNRGTFMILSVISATSCTIANSNAVAGDAGMTYGLQGVRNARIFDNYAINRSTRQLGSVASVTAVGGGMATVTGLSGMTSAKNVNLLLTIAGAAQAGNRGAFVIAEVLSSSSVKIINPNAVAGDAQNGAITWTCFKNFNDRDVTPGRMQYFLNVGGLNDTGCVVGPNRAINMEVGMVQLPGAFAGVWTGNFIDANTPSEASVILAGSGAPTDALFANIPADGTLYVDTTNSKLYSRGAGTWKGVTIA